MNILEKNIDAVRTICRTHDVQELYVFGSVLRDDFTPQSDIDLLVTFGNVPLMDYFDNFMDFKEDMEGLFGRNVDILELDTVKNPILHRRLMLDRVLLYEREDSQVAV